MTQEEITMTLTCLKCGHKTNSAVSKWRDSPDPLTQATGCYARMTKEGDKWEKGCCFDEADKFMKRYAENLFTAGIDWNANKDIWQID